MPSIHQPAHPALRPSILLQSINPPLNHATHPFLHCFPVKKATHAMSTFLLVLGIISNPSQSRTLKPYPSHGDSLMLNPRTKNDRSPVLRRVNCRRTVKWGTNSLLEGFLSDTATDMRLFRIHFQQTQYRLRYTVSAFNNHYSHRKRISHTPTKTVGLDLGRLNAVSWCCPCTLQSFDQMYWSNTLQLLGHMLENSRKSLTHAHPLTHLPIHAPPPLPLSPSQVLLLQTCIRAALELTSKAAVMTSITPARKHTHTDTKQTKKSTNCHSFWDASLSSQMWVGMASLVCDWRTSSRHDSPDLSPPPCP